MVLFYRPVALVTRRVLFCFFLFVLLLVLDLRLLDTAGKESAALHLDIGLDLS